LTEIILQQNIFPVPTTPQHVLGVINLRGNIVPIVDIRPALFLPQESTPSQIALVRHGHMFFGIVVDSVSEVISVPESSFLPLPPDNATQNIPAGRSRFFKAAVQREGGVAVLLDIDRLIEGIKLS
jgi:chemotaxis signal transduction protein